MHVIDMLRLLVLSLVAAAGAATGGSGRYLRIGTETFGDTPNIAKYGAVGTYEVSLDRASKFRDSSGFYGIETRSLRISGEGRTRSLTHTYFVFCGQGYSEMNATLFDNRGRQIVTIPMDFEMTRPAPGSIAATVYSYVCK